MAEEQPRASPSTTDSSPGPHSPAPNQSVPAAAASYLGGAPAAFAAQADVLFVAAGGEELPAHSQFLARSCQLFAEMLDPGGGVEGRPAPGRPLRVLLRAHAAADIARALRGVYHPHEIAELATGLRGAAAYGVQLDLAAFLRFGQLEAALREPLASRTPRMGQLVRFQFAAWLELAERHSLGALRSYCLECLLHLLAAPGCTGRAEEPGVADLRLEALSKADLLLLLDGMAAGVRRCQQETYMLRARVPCSAAAAASQPMHATQGTPPQHSLQSAGFLPGGGASQFSAAPSTPPSSPPSSSLHGSPGSCGGVYRRAADHVAAVAVPKLRASDMAGSLPGEAAIAVWRRVGDLCRIGGGA